MSKISGILILLLSFCTYAQDSLEFINLGPAINTAYDESNPLVSSDGTILYFIRNDHPANTLAPQRTQDIWYSVFNQEDSTWSEAVHMDFPFNQTQYNAIYSISPSGHTALIKGAYKNGKYKSRGLSLTHKKNGRWTLPEMIHVEDFDKMSLGLYEGAFLCNDGKTLLLYMSESSTTAPDIYVSFRKNNQTWTRPLSLGKDINTSYLEASPFLAADGKTLFFSSTRPGGLGDSDIYRSVRLDDTWTRWTKPENLGKPVNSEKRETYYSLSASGDYGYIVIKPGQYGKSDIVKIQLKEALRPEPVALLTGKVLNAHTGQPLEATIQMEQLSDGQLLGLTESDPGNGQYKLILPPGRHYGLSATARGYYTISQNIDLSLHGEYTEIEKDLLLVPIQKGQTIRLNNIFFESGSAQLTINSTAELNHLHEVLLLNPKLKIEIAGHTDNIGDDHSNMLLSEARAKSVAAFLLSKGISSKRISAKGYGETRFIDTNETEEGRQNNRRVEFIILDF